MDLIGLSTIVIFVAIIVLASLEKLEKSILALIGITLIYLIFSTFEHLTFKDIIEFIDFTVLVTILGFMIIVEASKGSGLFHFVSLRTVKLSKGDPYILFIILCTITAIMATFLTAMATMIIIGTLTITITRMLKIDPAPYILAEAIIVDVGGMTLPFSQIANIIISQTVGLSLIFFVINILPFVLLSFVYTIWFLFRRLKRNIGLVDPRRKMLIMEVNEWIFVPDMKVFKRSAIIFGMIIVALVTIPQIFIVALVGAIVFLIASGVKTEEIFSHIDWNTLIFFTGLYVIVGAMEHKGILHEAGVALGQLTMGNIFVSSILILWVVGVLSGLIDNVAIALSFIPIIYAMGEVSNLGPLIQILWIAMLFGTNLGGNLFPYGSPTTILAMGLSKKHGTTFDMKTFMKLGSTWGIGNLIIATIYLAAKLYAETYLSSIYFYALFYPIIFIGLILFIIIIEGINLSDIARYLKFIGEKFSRLRG